MFLSKLFKKEIKELKPAPQLKTPKKDLEKIAARKGELGEYKIDIQLSQFPQEYKVLSDLLIHNPKAMSGYSQIDHVIISPYAIFVIETKNYQGTVYGGADRKEWLVNGNFKFMNPFIQNYGHIQALKTILDPKFHGVFVSIVSFTKRCTFKTDLSYRKIQSSELIVYDVELTEFINRKISVLKLLNSPSLLSEKEIEKCYKEISIANITETLERDRHIQTLKDAPKKCIICGTSVSDKVAGYCNNNSKFKGNIYCFEHQKKL